jgi:hypothetical protein
LNWCRPLDGGHPDATELMWSQNLLKINEDSAFGGLLHITDNFT